MADLPPEPPASIAIYNSYAIDPLFAQGFTIAWTSAVGLAVLLAAPALFRSIRKGRAWRSYGLWEDLYGKGYSRVKDVDEKIPARRQRILAFDAALSYLGTRGLFSLRWLNLNVGQMVIVGAYYATLLFCIIYQAPLLDNPNRAGFMTLAQLPVVFLFATKNGAMNWLLGSGYEKLNFLHRWAGRGIFVSATIHGSLWIRNHLMQDPALLSGTKETLGMAAYGTLGLLMLMSLYPVRRFAYQIFFASHVLGYTAFFIIICYHTPYAPPWIIPPIAFYAFDVVVRMLRFRIKDAILTPVDNCMTLVHIPDCDGGWIAGQHVRLRVFFSGRVFESHPLTIYNAPAAMSATTSQGMMLAANVQGSWTRALNNLAKDCNDKLNPVSVMVDGPYGGCTFDLGDYENVLLVAGGSGVTFTLGLLDDLVGRIVRLGRPNKECTRRIDFVWCIKSFGCIHWFSPMFLDIANKAKESSVDLRITCFVTCLCNPESLPDIPNFEVTLSKPSIKALVSNFLVHPDDISSRSVGGGLGIAVSGPRSITQDAQNVVACLTPIQVAKLQGVQLHTELFSL